MPWCPKCKNEYVEGITTCADCGVDLVDELPEEIDPEMPSIICRVTDEVVGGKFVFYLNMQGIQTAGLMPVTAEDEDQADEDNKAGYYVVVANFEEEAATTLFEGFDKLEEIDEDQLKTIAPELEDKLKELQDEEANIMLSDLRTESSSVYVKKKDKYSDLKFSGISFIVFGILGFGLLLLNILEYVDMFNKFSTLIMAIVFAAFFIIGITSLLRARKMKNIVSQEEVISDDVLNWIDENITDKYIETLINPDLGEEDNYFASHEAMCKMVMDKFPLFNPNYLDQMIDDRYNEYCESVASSEGVEDIEDIDTKDTDTEDTEEKVD